LRQSPRQDDLHFKPTIEVLRVDFSRMAFDRALRDGKPEASTTRVPIAGLIHSLCKLRTLRANRGGWSWGKWFADWSAMRTASWVSQRASDKNASPQGRARLRVTRRSATPVKSIRVRLS
jgi:hypothetical protein